MKVLIRRGSGNSILDKHVIGFGEAGHPGEDLTEKGFLEKGVSESYKREFDMFVSRITELERENKALLHEVKNHSKQVTDLSKALEESKIRTVQVSRERDLLHECLRETLRILDSLHKRLVSLPVCWDRKSNEFFVCVRKVVESAKGTLDFTEKCRNS